MPDPPARSALRQQQIDWRLSGHACRLLTLAVTGLALAVGTGRPEFAGLAAPAVLLLAGLRAGRPAHIGLRARLTDIHVVEGTEYAATVTIQSHGYATAEFELEPADEVAAGPPVTVAGYPMGDRPGVPGVPGVPGRAVRSVRVPFLPERWGHRDVGVVAVTLRDRLRLTEGHLVVSLPRVDCRPLPAQLRTSIVLSRLPARLGEHSSRAVGEGAEFAGVRAFVPGDRQRRINWPATTRLGTLHLSTFAAERAENTVVIADTTANVGEPGASSLDLVVRGAAGAINRYLAARDRVGLIVFGGRLSWIGPGQGRRHFQRLIDLLVSAPAGWDRAAELTRLPRAALPPGALILVFSPLLDPRLIESVRDLRERGFSVLVVDVLNAEPEHNRSGLSRLSGRLWRLEQQAVRYSLLQIGVPVVRWDGTSSLDEPLAPYSRRAVVVRR